MASVAKTYRLSFEYVLYGISYANVVLYTAVLPTYTTDNNKNELKADDPQNTKATLETLALWQEQE